MSRTISFVMHHQCEMFKKNERLRWFIPPPRSEPSQDFNPFKHLGHRSVFLSKCLFFPPQRLPPPPARGWPVAPRPAGSCNPSNGSWLWPGLSVLLPAGEDQNGQPGGILLHCLAINQLRFTRLQVVCEPQNIQRWDIFTSFSVLLELSQGPCCSHVTT